MSPLAQIDGWFIKNPPWKQIARGPNNDDQFAPDWEMLESQCRAIMELRMRLIPYLHSAFVRYHREGVPPFRALVLDYPDDAQTWTIDDQFILGESLLVAPTFAGEFTRSVYLPAGEWFDYWTRRRHLGPKRLGTSAPLAQIPIFVKSDTLLPLAEATLHTDDPASWRITVQVYGDRPRPATLYEDDGAFAPALDEVVLSWDSSRRAGSVKRAAQRSGPAYDIVAWNVVSEPPTIDRLPPESRTKSGLKVP
jgi:alpha-D-xyloside xylohydrolase